MPVATLLDDQDRSRSFYVDFCPVYVLYGRTLFALQPGTGWENDGTYRATAAAILDDTMRTDRRRPEAAAE